jgi:hypothetical protein
VESWCCQLTGSMVVEYRCNILAHRTKCLTAPMALPILVLAGVGRPLFPFPRFPRKRREFQSRFLGLLFPEPYECELPTERP